MIANFVRSAQSQLAQPQRCGARINPERALAAEINVILQLTERAVDLWFSFMSTANLTICFLL
jgi:hypothetical protein